MDPVTQLQFNLDVPANIENLKTQFTSPCAIVFERIVEKKDPKRPRNPNSPVKSSVLSSHKLSQAMQLARRDIKSAKRNKMLREFAREQQLDAKLVQTNENGNLCSSLATQQTQTVVIQQKSNASPPKRPRKARVNEFSGNSNESQDTQDIRRLCLELQQLVYCMEKRMNDREIIYHQKFLMNDPDEEQRLVIRHLEQMRKSSRTVYALQRQVEVIKGDLSKSSPRKIQGLKKDRTLNRLAAVHRGTVRLLQLYSIQLPEHLVMGDNFVAVNALYQEVSKLIRELLLCSLQLGLIQISQVQKILDIMKSIEPKQLPKPVTPGRRSPAKHPRTPTKSFRSKQPILVKKGFLIPHQLQNSMKNTPKKDPIRRNDMNVSETVYAPHAENSHLKRSYDLFDRPEWLPPSNSPHKDVGPPPLGPLLKTPSSVRPKQNKSQQSPMFKHVNFCSTPHEGANGKEHDIDLLPSSDASDMEQLKDKLAQELEMEIRERIQPLLQQVNDLSKSSKQMGQSDRNKKKSSQEIPQEILENQIRDIVKETAEEMERFKKQQDSDVQHHAVNLYQGPSLETLMTRLETIDKEEEAIRRHWRQINYKDTRLDNEVLSQDSVDFVAGDPSPINFTNTRLQSGEAKPSKRIVKLVPGISTGTTEAPSWTRYETDNTRKDPKPFTGRTLNLPPSTFLAITKKREEYERHLKYSFHEAKGKFNPWNLVEELSDDILKEVISSVTNEVNGVCENYANEMFQREFADGPQPSDSSILTSAESSLQSNVSFMQSTP